MYVTPEVKARVVAKLQAGIALAEARYGVQIPMPRITYEKRGTTAGTAAYRTWTVDFNAVLLMQNVDTFIARTVPHELAHLITFKVYPETWQDVGIVRTRVGFKRGKREVHGPRWQEVMAVLGVADSTRCHSYDVSSVKVVKSTSRQIAWKCSRCNAELMLTPKKSDMLRNNPAALWHRGCRGAQLIRVDGTTPVVKPVVAAPVVPSLSITRPADLRLRALLNEQLHQPAARLPAASSMDGMSKIDKCKAIYQRNQHESRSMIIQMFVNAGCTAAGAATYYATCKKLFS